MSRRTLAWMVSLFVLVGSHAAWSDGLALEIQGVTRTAKVAPGDVTEKGGCRIEVVVVYGIVRNAETNQRVSGALITGTLTSDDDVDRVFYFDHYTFGSCPFVHCANGVDESRAISTSDGFYELLFEVCIDDFAFNWEAIFDVCAQRNGFATTCATADFDSDDFEDERDIRLTPIAATPTTTPTPTVTLTSTPTPTPTISPTAGEPTLIPTAVYPALDVDGDGVIGAGDLILLMRDWNRPVQ